MQPLLGSPTTVPIDVPLRKNSYDDGLPQLVFRIVKVICVGAGTVTFVDAIALAGNVQSPSERDKRVIKRFVAISNF